MVHIHACAFGSESLDSCVAAHSVNLCTPPWKPCKWANPPTGGRREPVANCRSCSRSTCVRERTARQNQRKRRERRCSPPTVRQWRLQSSTFMSGSPASMHERSDGLISVASFAMTGAGTATWSPRSIACT
eukprot:scaffold3767_cov114-Isochrysis_galbana.AAC.12